MSRGGSKSAAQAFISSGRDRPGEVDVDDVRAELDKDGDADGNGGVGVGRVAFEDDGWFTPLLVRELENVFFRFVFCFVLSPLWLVVRVRVLLPRVYARRVEYSMHVYVPSTG